MISDRLSAALARRNIHYAWVMVAVGHDPTTGCSATSKPSATYPAACWLVRTLFG